MKWPKVSIVIPVYDREWCIGACLASIKKQSYPKGKIEVVLVDGQSSDKTVEIAKSFQKDGGPMDLRIFTIKDPLAQKIGEPGKMMGISKMTGDFYFYLDSDAELVSKNFVKKLIHPLVQDPELAGSFTRYLPSKKQNAFNRYVSYNELQLWSMLAYLVPSIASVTIEKKKKYDVVEIDPDKSPPIGMAFFRKKFLDEIVGNPKTFNYVDIAIPLQLAEAGHNKMAYVASAGMYHARAEFKREFWRQKRDVTITYLPVVGERKFQYIDFGKPMDVVRVIGWVIWVELVVPSLIVGVYKSIKYRDLAGMYELPTNFLLTNYIIYLFLTDSNGRRLIKKILGGKEN